MPRLIVPLAAALAVAAITAGYLWQQLRAERELAASWQQQVTGLQQQVAQLEQRLQAPAATVRPVPQPQVAAASPQPVTADPAPAPGVAGRRIVDPAARNKAWLAMMYPDVEKVLDLTAAEADALAQLLGTLPPDAAVEAQLGSKAGLWQEYKVTVEARRRTSELQQMLARSSHPLSDQQVQQLVPTIVAEQQRTAQEAIARGPRPADQRARLEYDEESLRATEARYRRIGAAARSFMSTEQVTLMESSQNRALATQRANLQVQRAQLEAGGNTAATWSQEYAVPVDVVLPPAVAGGN